MAISAIAARRLAVAQQQQETIIQLSTLSSPSSSTATISEASPTQINQEHPHSQSDEDSNPRKKYNRYFAAPPTPEAQSSRNSNPKTSSSPGIHNNNTPSKSPKRRNHSGFIESECVSDWTPILDGVDQNYLKLVNENQHQTWIIGLRAGQNLIPHGTLQLQVISGAVEVMGSEIVAPSLQPTTLFAPPSHPLPIITPKNVETDRSTTQNQLPLDPSKFHAIIQLQDFHCGIQAIDELWSSNGTKRPIWSSSPNPHSIYGQTWSIVLSPTPDLARLRLPASWSSVISSLSPTTEDGGRPEIYFIEGPKGTGKSTFSTLLINSLLNTFQNVALLDLDPGQPLLTPPTLLSLHILNSPILGPSFCRLAAPHQPSSHSIYLGHTTPRDCPTRYTEASLELFNFYTSLQSDLTASLSTNKRRRLGRNSQVGIESNDTKRTDQIPLVINTMGWTRGLGQDLLNQLLHTIQPTQTFSFSDRLLVVDMQPSERQATLEPIGPTPLSLRLTPADSRVLAIVSYMYSTPSPGPNLFMNQWEFQYPLWARRPFEVRPDRIQLPDHPDFDHDHLGQVLNGGLIGFINRSQGWWIGFGLIRAIDPSRKTIHLLAPAYPTTDQNQAEYEFVKYSEPELPLICCLSQGTVPYLEKESIGTNASATIGSEKKRVRRNVQRRSQITR
ncbi:hypothetical protein Pst134EA_000009 [Puccinia striiformis f. sp. tritici]|uniref:hypothetical protein n=1 Tax=Puccinia striiformis f. sp. tritici TaxID=168172 RepID=UPI000A1278E0|nr:hypothetical protein Pst134EA_000009 [Puccinia striiformis f. sp. tritici]KAH9472923.1 hypothetical protein Pst134EA_000009 [Puccinia striiformis f. sp. tritici]